MVFHCLLSSKHYSLVTFPVQQEVATEAALTLVPHAVVLAIYTHSTFFCGTLRHPVLNLIKVQKEKTKETSLLFFAYLLFTYNHKNASRMADTYAVGVQREEPWILKGLLMFISG